MTSRFIVRGSRAVQVGFLMRAYRESFLQEDGLRGLTQEELLRRMALVDPDYAERYSHATVSRWESGRTRPNERRLEAFGKTLDLSESEVAGLMSLAGFTASPEAALVQDSPDAAVEEITAPALLSELEESADSMETERVPSTAHSALRFGFFRCLPSVVLVLVLGYVLWLIG